MKKLLTGILFLSLINLELSAQTKVFKEVSQEISTEIKTIRQDNALVGYLVFTKLEKASEDSFNYKITVMDENLNDIGTVKFREIRLNLQAVSFEQDVLCLAYLKSNIIGTEFRNNKAFKAAIPKQKNSLLLQFLSLDGRIVKSESLPVEIDVTTIWGLGGRLTAEGRLKHDIQLQNISGKGFACFYGDQTKNMLRTYGAGGNQMWNRQIKEVDVQAFGLLTSGDNAYLLMKKKDDFAEGGFELLGFGVSDSTSFPKYVLKDKQNNSLKVLTFENDQQTGKPYLTGLVINPTRGNSYSRVQDIAKGTYNGVFTINIDGRKKGDIKETFSYWNDNSQTMISRTGKIKEDDRYARYARSFKDSEGNTYFTGSSFVKRTRVGACISAGLFCWLLLPPIALAANGTVKTKISDAVILKQNTKGALSLETPIPGNKGQYMLGKYPMSMMDTRSYYNVFNANTRTDYLIVDDVKDIIIYNVNQKKVVRTIPHRDGNVSTYIYPAKEGHVMVSEYNRKEKYTRFSIEAL